MALSDLFIAPESLPGGAYGYIQLFFLLVIYGYILFKASKYIADGSELLTLVMSPGLIGGLVLPVMGAVPDGAIVLFSGLGPNAQAQLNVGVGTLAGSTIMLLTIPWAASLWIGRVDLSEDGSKALYKQRPKLTRPPGDVVHTGVQPSADIPFSAYLMLATGATYLVVQGPSWAKDSPGVDRAFALAGLLLSISAFVGYSAYCLLSATALEAQKAKATALRKRALADHLVGFTTMLRIEESLAAEALGDRLSDNGEGGDGSSRSLLIGGGGATPEKGGARASARSTGAGAGSATVAALHRLFDKYDADGSGSIDLSELKVMLRDLGLPRMSGEEIKSLMRDVGGEDMAIQFNEFEELVARCAQQGEARASRAMFTGVGGKERRGSRASVTPSQASDVEDEEDEEDDDDEEGEDPNMTPAQIKAKALFLLVAGVGLVTFFSDPMVDVLSELGTRMGIKPFYVSFVISPLVSNASELISAIVFAGRKTQGSMDMTLSALLGAATMNNTFCLAIFLGLVYIRDLSWAFSAEVTAILAAEVAMVFVARMRVVPVWTAVLPALLYPASLLLVWFLENIVGWD